MTKCELYNQVNPFGTVLTDNSSHDWVALKIMTAAMTETSREARWFDALAKCRSGDQSSSYIVKLLDRFVFDGPNGKHLALVFELLGPNVRSLVGSEYPDRTNIDPSTIMRMTEQLLKALAFIHQTGFAHGGMFSYRPVSELAQNPCHILTRRLIYNRYKHQKHGIYRQKPVKSLKRKTL